MEVNGFADDGAVFKLSVVVKRGKSKKNSHTYVIKLRAAVDNMHYR